MKGSVVMEHYGDEAMNRRPLRHTVQFESWDNADEVEAQLLAAKTELSSPILDLKFQHVEGNLAELRVEVMPREVEVTPVGRIYLCVRSPQEEEVQEVMVIIPASGKALIVISH